MNLESLASILLRRWYVTVPVAALFLYLAAGVAGAPTYTVETNFLLLLPEAETEVDEDLLNNPVIDTTTRANRAASLAVAVLESDRGRQSVSDAGYSDIYSFAVSTSQPFVELEVSAGNPDLARQTSLALAEVFVEELRTQQLRFNADPESIARAEFLETSAPEKDSTSARAAQGVASLVGLLFAALAAIAVEWMAYARRVRNDPEFANEVASPIAAPEPRAPRPSQKPRRRVSDVVDEDDDEQEPDDDLSPPAPRAARWSRRQEA